MKTTREKLDVAVWAYVIMPELVHIILSPQGPQATMERIFAGLKRSVSKKARDYLTTTRQTRWLEKLTVRYPSRTVFRFWQPGGGYDHNIWHEKSLAQVIEYLHGNPVRRGLVDSPTDWYWSTARFYEGDRDFPLVMDPIDL